MCFFFVGRVGAGKLATRVVPKAAHEFTSSTTASGGGVDFRKYLPVKPSK